MSLYTLRLNELAAELGIAQLEPDESGHACLTLDRLWAIHLAPMNEVSIVMFLRAGLLTGESQARELLRGNLFTAAPTPIRVALGQDDHLILWCQLSLEDVDAQQLHLALRQLMAKAIALTSDMETPQHSDHRSSLRV